MARGACGIVVGTQIAARLVDQPVDVLFALHRLAVDGDALPRLDLRAQFPDSLAVDAHPAGKNQFLAVTPRAKAGVGKVFVETFHRVH